MAEEINYGRIALIPKGDFAGDVQYDQGDVVAYNGSSYIAKSKPPVATLPTDTKYWQLSANGIGENKADKSVTIKTTLLASDWTGDTAPYILTLSVEGVTETNNIEVLPPPNLYELDESIRDAMCNADIDGGKQGVGWIELIANDEKPTVDLPVIVIVRGD